MKTHTRNAAEALLGGGPQTPASVVVPSATRIDAKLNGGVQTGSMGQALQPFLGETALPTGQIINVSMNAPNPNLEFKEWMARGVVGGVGKVAAWPFRLIGMTLESAALAIVDVLKTVLKWAVIVVLIPTLGLVGMRLMHMMSQSTTIEGGASAIMHDGRHVVNGMGKGLTDDLPAEVPVKTGPAHPHRGARDDG